MATSLITVGGPPFLTNLGTLNAGGFIYFYETGTSTPKTVYKDSGLSQAHEIPIELDAYGWPPGNAIWCSGDADMEIQNSSAVSLRTVSNINQTSTTASINTVAVKSDDYTIVAADDSKTLAQTAAEKTFSTSDNAATLGDGFTVFLQNRSTGTLTFNPNGAETVTDGETAAATLVLPPYYSARVVCDGTNWVAQVTPIWTDIVNDNWLINGGFQVGQRGAGPFTSASTVVNNDDTYLFDQWILVSEANDAVDVSRISTAAIKSDAATAAIDFDVETSNKKFGFLQILDSQRTKSLYKNATGLVSLSFTACQAGGGATKWKAAVLAWSGTVDTVTSDIVSAWGAEGTTPTWIANVTAENTPATLTLTTSPQRFEIENIALDTASTTNLLVFLWTDDQTMTAGTDHVYLSAVKLEMGPYATEFQENTFTEDYWDCLYFYRRWIRNNSNEAIGAGVAVGTTTVYVPLVFPRTMRTTPTITVSAAGDFILVSGNDEIATDSNGVSPTQVSQYSVLLLFTAATSITNGRGCVVEFDATSGAFINFSAEL